MTTREWAWSTAPSPARYRVARALRSCSRRLRRLAAMLAGHRQAPPRELPLFEFHAEAGAPEGALFVDGKFVGHVPGVRRL